MLLMYTVSPEKVKVPLTPNFKNVSVSLEIFRFEGKYTVFLGVFFSLIKYPIAAPMHAD